MNQQPNEEIYAGGSEGASTFWEFGDGQSSMQKLSGSPIWMFSEVPLLGFYGGSNTQALSAPSDWFNLQPLPPPRKSGGGTESSNPLFMVGSLAICPHTWALSKSHLINISSVVVQREFSWKKDTHFIFMTLRQLEQLWMRNKI